MPTEIVHYPYLAAVLDCPSMYRMIAYASVDGVDWIEQGVDSWWQEPLLLYDSPENVDIARERFDWSVEGCGWGRVYWCEMRTGLVPGEGDLIWRFDASERVGNVSSFFDPRGRQWNLSRHEGWNEVPFPDGSVIVGSGADAYLETELGWVWTPDFGHQPDQFVIAINVGEELMRHDIYVKSGYTTPTRGWEFSFMRRPPAAEWPPTTDETIDEAAIVGGGSYDGHGVVENFIEFADWIEVEVPEPEPPPGTSIHGDVCLWKEKLDSTITVDKPAVSWCQLGSPTMTCESYAVGTSGVREEPLFPAPGMECQMLTIIDLVGAIARECAFEGNDDGTTNPTQVEAVSAQQDADTIALMAWAEGLPRPPFATSTVQYISEGGLAVTMLSTSAYAGWT